MKSYLSSLLSLILLLTVVGCSCSGGGSSYESRIERPEKARRIANINFKKEFNDLNDTHLSAARAIGVAAHNVDSVEGSDIIDAYRIGTVVRDWSQFSGFAGGTPPSPV